ncbi:hypothetical protein DY000_02034632 [Brassica cretica]|uniref:Uncharacterized protein n=1 Tax=Brassica cretica TaxID=69181 RepID=A0ABQ7DR96_BRACR|nr:hypothetical protein DY000_02034632 [Brassica cretica]
MVWRSADQNSKTDEYITFKIVGDVAVAADRRRKQGVEMVFDDHNRDESLPGSAGRGSVSTKLPSLFRSLSPWDMKAAACACVSRAPIAVQRWLRPWR